MMSRTGRLTGALSCAAGAVGLTYLALRSAALAAFHYWAAGGPPNPDPSTRDWHSNWGTVFACAMLAALVGAGYFLRLGWLAVRRRQIASRSSRIEGSDKA